MTPFTMIMFFGNSEIEFSHIIWLDCKLQRINARKGNAINIVQGSKSSKTMILSKFT